MPMGHGVQVKAIKPPSYYQQAFEREYKQVMHDMGEKVKREAQALTKNWKNKVRWHYRVYSKYGELGFNLYVEDDKAGKIFSYWELGTKRHRIRAKKGKSLAFFWPKGKAMNVQAPMLPDGRFLFKEVMHPGTKAHLKLAEIAARNQKIFLYTAQRATAQAVNRCGHGTQGPIRMR